MDCTYAVHEARTHNFHTIRGVDDSGRLRAGIDSEHDFHDNDQQASREETNQRNSYGNTEHGRFGHDHHGHQHIANKGKAQARQDN